MDSMTRTNLRKNLFRTIDKVNKENTSLEITINSNDGTNEGVVMLSKREYERMQEELYLRETYTLDYVFDLMDNFSEDDFEEL
ncbi:type II toxin-antitoxin system Phd/YefM family antitoxin [Tetragenococcus halophilus]|uniref:Type II toxin-antitoxin system Phd/YefM family antitoxin n=1 Tax=Tetragenococcus halophilus TaxID=51669 RepID=A0AB35HSR1_TETHA|nr:type II toxin-antitoxin system prevent-host-death family antitoxin [Tetragenococcus halophilus]MCO8289806.1 type II toxin-antitoxin system Phd/YefM family antitoxin [Tetragenococcus halophilus]MCO8292036.1 type II toxin-antitoxin system Phd/YefM family antitoxin [Tetragenococcus halophilus]MCO8296416.1 type II toxin-antitoxin system Phd/YefM family antitoxin [Tetragenococcus halophilus]MCO8298825.1 type II toxin-antitoxin system Phd/YefM family antitoxin [Tetragenococcus halophilus]MCT83109